MIKQMIEKIKLVFISTKRLPRKIRQKTRAQSMVEFALLLPILILLLLVMVEYGFMLNTYLSLTDATRQAARVYSNEQPFKTVVVSGVDTKVDDLTYYGKVANMLVSTLNSNSYRIQYDSSVASPDNVLVSVITVDVDTTPNPDTFTFTRHPDGKEYFSLNSTSGTLSKYKDNNTIKGFMETSGRPVDAGLLIVEVYYSYEGTLKIPNWFNLAIFPTDGNPIILYASTIMPLTAAKPPRPTITP